MTGLRVIRGWRRVGRRMRRMVAALARLVDRMLSGFEGLVDRVRRSLSDDSASPLHKLRRHTSSQAHVAHAYYTNGIFAAIGQWLKLSCVSARRNLFRVWRALNYVVPIACACALVLIISYVMELNLALSVSLNGEVIAYVQDESIYEKAQAKMRELITYSDESEIREIQVAPVFSLAIVQNDDIVGESKLCDTLLTMSSDQIISAMGLYIDGVFFGATERGRMLSDQIESILERYKIDEEDRAVFVENVELRNGIYPVGAVKSYSEISSLLLGSEASAVPYTVEPGDSPESVAEKMNVPISTLQALNPDLTKRMEAGAQIYVTDKPLLQVALQKTIVFEEQTPFSTVQQMDASENRGFTRVIQNGVPGVSRVTADVTYLNGKEISRTILSIEQMSSPISKIVRVGTKMPDQFAGGTAESSSVGNGTMMHPLGGLGYVSCRIWGYSGHKGTDYASKRGTPIYATDSGVVVKKIYNGGGYGHYLVIDHGYGVQTLYAHCSELYAELGQIVAQGELIAAVGVTGNTTGPHVHWEMYINGAVVDGDKYVESGNRYR